MPWNEADRERYNIVRERYTSDLSDEEYALIEPLLPQPERRGRKPTPARTILNTIFYLARCACSWRYMPKDFPPYTTVQNRFYQLRDSGILTQIICLLVQNAREQAEREAAPTAVIVDAQSVKTAGSGGPRGYGAGKKVKGRKRHIAEDTLGLPIECQITPANVQDRDALAPILRAVAFEASRIEVVVVKRTDKKIKGFVVLPKRWIAERTLGWINRSRRLAKDFEGTIESAFAWACLRNIRFTNIRLVAKSKRLAGQSDRGRFTE